MRCKLIVDGNAVYEVDEECMQRKQNKSAPKGEGGQESFQRQGSQNCRGQL